MCRSVQAFKRMNPDIRFAACTSLSYEGHGPSQKQRHHSGRALTQGKFPDSSLCFAMNPCVQDYMIGTTALEVDIRECRPHHETRVSWL